MLHTNRENILNTLEIVDNVFTTDTAKLATF